MAADVDLIGECIQTLKCLGYSESDELIRSAVKFLITTRDETTVSGETKSKQVF